MNNASTSLPSLFNNYETIKLVVENGQTVNFIILILLCGLFFLLLRKYPNNSSFEFLDRQQTEQLKGLAIVLVIVGHFWWHVAAKKPALIFADDAVALFFLLSGFGLTMSNRYKSLDLRHFLSRRVKRVMIPYWLATVFLLSLDFFILKRTYPIKDIMLTGLGINISQTTTHIDYVRWYITLLLLWYVLFFFASSKLKQKTQLPFLLGCGTVIFLFDYFVPSVFWYQIFAFPAGCLVANFYEAIAKFFLTKKKLIFFAAIILFCLALAYKIWIIHFCMNWLPSPLVKLTGECNSLIVSICLIVYISCLSYCNYYSNSLKFIGKYSYEIFLIHGAFLIKYDPIISSSSGPIVIIQLFTFFIFILFVAIIFQKVAKAAHAII